MDTTLWQDLATHTHSEYGADFTLALELAKRLTTTLTESPAGRKLVGVFGGIGDLLIELWTLTTPIHPSGCEFHYTCNKLDVHVEIGSRAWFFKSCRDLSVLVTKYPESVYWLTTEVLQPLVERLAVVEALIPVVGWADVTSKDTLTIVDRFARKFMCQAIEHQQMQELLSHA